jgi:hypothetical protein
MKKQVCSRCLNDTFVPGITFSDEGLCSICREYEKWQERLDDFEALETLWLKRLEDCKGKGTYDVVLGVSGGKDSTYVLSKLVNKYKLKVLTFTIDNGFLNDWGRERIHSVTDFLGVDHCFVPVEQKNLAAFYRYSIQLTGAPCTACSYFIYATTISLASKHGIPLAVHGRSRSQMFRFFSPESTDPFLPFIYAGLQDADEHTVKATYEKVFAIIKESFSQEFYDQIRAFLPDLSQGKPAEFLPYFLYHSYDEEIIVDHIQEHVGWSRPDNFEILSHYDCDAHDAAGYLYEIAETRPHIVPEISVLVRNGMLSRQEALARIEKEKFKESPGKSLDALSLLTGFNRDELIAFAQAIAARNT